MFGFLFDKVEGLQACNFLKIWLQHRCFFVDARKLLRLPILKNICERLHRCKGSRAVHTESVQSMSLLQNFMKINSQHLMQLVFISGCIKDYHRRRLNTFRFRSKNFSQKNLINEVLFFKIKMSPILCRISNLYILSDSYTP